MRTSNKVFTCKVPFHTKSRTLYNFIINFFPTFSKIFEIRMLTLQFEWCCYVIHHAAHTYFTIPRHSTYGCSQFCSLIIWSKTDLKDHTVSEVSKIKIHTPNGSMEIKRNFLILKPQEKYLVFSKTWKKCTVTGKKGPIYF